MTPKACVFSVICLMGFWCLVSDLAAFTYRWNVSAERTISQKPATLTQFDQGRPIAVVVNEANQVNDLTVRQLARIYSGEVTEWPSGESITVINRPIQSDIRVRFYRQVLNAKPTQKFFQTGSPIPFETQRVDSEAAIIRFVERDRGAIAYCYVPCVAPSVKVISVGGRLPDQDGYALQ
jgi:ABC-type phosphate transport system substrate-binding protein